MNISIRLAYKTVFGIDPAIHNVFEWEAARDLLQRWDVPKLGERLAKECILQFINHTVFPSEVNTREFIADLKAKFRELFPEIGDRDINPDTAAWQERRFLEEETP